MAAASVGVTLAKIIGSQAGVEAAGRGRREPDTSADLDTGPIYADAIRVDGSANPASMQQATLPCSLAAKTPLRHWPQNAHTTLHALELSPWRFVFVCVSCDVTLRIV